MGKTNTASSGFTLVQAGSVGPRDDAEQDEPASRPQPKTRGARGRVVNVRSGNARVGEQVDVVAGDLTVRM